ncbi:MAG: GrpB family protein [Xanthomonadales bacterium]|nr:GrpB family protein [Xanthomonadales bacterium]
MTGSSQLAYLKALKTIKQEVGSLHGVPILDYLRHWRDVRGPEISLQQSPYQTLWSEIFRHSAEELSTALDVASDDIHHIGSTSIPNMSAKPIIDQVLSVAAMPISHHGLHRLEQLGYVDYGASPVHPEVIWLWHRSAVPAQRVLHVCQRDNPWLQDALNFRDYLSQFDDQRLAYQQRKQALAAACAENLPLYSLEKATLLYRMSKAANRWRAEQALGPTST